MGVLENSKHEAVVRALLVDPEAVGWRAYRSVYRKCSQRAAETGFTRLMKNPEFASRVAELKGVAAEGAVLRAREVLEALSTLACSNMKDYVGEDDLVLPIPSLSRQQAAAVLECTVEYYTEGRGEDARQVKRVRFKLCDKLRALELLGKHHKLFTDKVEHEAGVTLEQLVLASARSRGHPV